MLKISHLVVHLCHTDLNFGSLTRLVSIRLRRAPFFCHLASAFFLATLAVRFQDFSSCVSGPRDHGVVELNGVPNLLFVIQNLTPFYSAGFF